MSLLSQKFSVFLIACAFACSAFALDSGLQAVPALTSHVTDLTATLDADQQQELDAQLAALEQRKGAQVAVLIVPTTQPEDIAAYAIRVFDTWKLGRKDIDDGALLVIAKNDRSMRIEVARGLEGTIPDAAAARIVREYLTPKFRDGDFYGGIKDALDAMTKLVDGEPLPEPWKESARSNGGDPFNAVMFGLIAGFWARSMFGRLSSAPRAGLVGAVSGGVGWFISNLWPLGIGLGVFGAILGFFGGGGGGFANRGGWGNWGGGGFGGGGFGGGGGGGSSGGGFSGGGGISAGGGASGRW